MPKKIVVVLKGYPRLSETFIAQELLGLEQAGFQLSLVALRRPSDAMSHPIHDEIKAPILYLPEYLHDDPGRLFKAWRKARRLAGYAQARRAFLSDLRRDPTRHRIRRFGQALVLAAELPAGAEWLHAHFIHTPASVAAYASRLTGLAWTCSAHAKDIWTSPDWELADKLVQARWVVTCTKAGLERLRRLTANPENVHLSYHGLDLSRFGPFAGERARRDGTDPRDPVVLLSVGRAVAKKGYDVLLRALALLPKELAWRFVHVGGGEHLKSLEALAAVLGLAERVSWLGAQPQTEVLARYRAADLFVLACRIAADGDRDGLPNVLVEAASQRLACVSTLISGVPELIVADENGVLVPPDEPPALARAVERLIRDPSLRRQLGEAAERRVRAHFDHRAGLAKLARLFESVWARPA